MDQPPIDCKLEYGSKGPDFSPEKVQQLCYVLGKDTLFPHFILNQ